MTEANEKVLYAARELIQACKDADMQVKSDYMDVSIWVKVYKPETVENCIRIEGTCGREVEGRFVEPLPFEPEKTGTNESEVGE